MQTSLGCMCWDWFGDFTEKTVTDPIGATLGYGRVFRGGSYYYGADNQVTCHFELNPNSREHDVGFRICLPSLQ